MDRGFYLRETEEITAALKLHTILFQNLTRIYPLEKKESGMAECIEPTHQRSSKILIADTHELFGKSLALLLQEAGVGTVHFSYTGRQTVEATLTLKPDLVLLDRSLQDMDSFAVLATLKYLMPDTLVIMLISFVDTSSMARARELGIDGFYSKGIDPNQLVSAIRSLLSENNSPIPTQYPSTPTAAPLSLRFRKKTMKVSVGEDLTKKEQLILALISMGYENQKISQLASISHNTLKTHLRKIYSKIGVSDRTQAAIWAIRNGYAVETFG